MIGKIVYYSRKAVYNIRNFFSNEKPDKNSLIEFYLIDSFEIYHFMPFYTMLRKEGVNAIFVAEPYYAHVSGKYFDYEEAKKILNEFGAEYSERANKDADYVFTTQDAYLVEKYKNAKKINLHYSCGFVRDNFCLTERTVRGFDIVLVNGKFQADKQKAFASNQIFFEVGFPKHIDFWKKPITQEDVKNELGIKTDKKILVYFPTYDNGCSCLEYGDNIKKTFKDYYIVTKLHHCLDRLEEYKNKKSKVENISNFILGGNYSFEKSAVLGDLLISDAKSGAGLEASYLNQKAAAILVAVRTEGSEYYDDMFKMFNVIMKPSDLSLTSKIENEDVYRQYRNENMGYYLGEHDDNAFKVFIDYLVGEIRRTIS